MGNEHLPCECKPRPSLVLALVSEERERHREINMANPIVILPDAADAERYEHLNTI